MFNTLEVDLLTINSIDVTTINPGVEVEIDFDDELKGKVL